MSNSGFQPNLAFLCKDDAYTLSGWWFGTMFIFPYIGMFIIPTDELIFFIGIETTNQVLYHMLHSIC